MRKNFIRIAVILAVCILTILIFSLIIGIFPVYLYIDGTLIVDNKPYGLYPIIDWYPTGDTYRIGSVSGDESSFLVFLYKYRGDENQMFLLKQPLLSDVNSLPMHRLDITFPSFSENVMDTVRVGIHSNMVHGDSMDFREITITDPMTIATIADYLSYPINTDKAKRIDDYASINFSSESNQYKNTYYELKIVVCDGKYYFMQRDETMYEVPLQLFEKIFDLDLYTPEEYLATEETKRSWLSEKWRCENDNGTFYLFMWMNDYIIIEAKDEKPILKESGLYKLDNDTLYFHDDKNLKSYSFNANLKNILLTPLSNETIYNAWKYDEESSVVLEYKSSRYHIEQIGSEYMAQANHLRYND